MVSTEVSGKNTYGVIDSLVKQGAGNFTVYDEKGHKIFQSPAVIAVFGAAAVPGLATAARVFAKVTRCKIVYQLPKPIQKNRK